VCEIRAPFGIVQHGTAVAVSPDGKQVAIGVSSEVSLHDGMTGRRVKTLDLTDLDGKGGFLADPGFMSFTPNGTTLVIAGSGIGPAIAVWDPVTDKVLGKFERTRRGATGTHHKLGALSPSGTTLATVGPTLQLWDLPAAKPAKQKPLQKE
jgi:WD40 repeat protein